MRCEGDSDALPIYTGSLKNAMSVGYQGVPGCNGEAPTVRYSPGTLNIPFDTFRDIFRAPEEEHIELAILPVENSPEGRVKEVNELLIAYDMMKVGEENPPISYSLLVNKGTDRIDIRYVYSHPQALGQCREFIEQNKSEAVPYYDTAGAALMLYRDRPEGSSAIARGECAELYDLEIAAYGIEDNPSNTTRFLVVDKFYRKEGNKISQVFSTKHEPGALYDILRSFAASGINLTRIESIPTRKEPWRYNFMVDLQGNIRDDKVRETLREVEAKTVFYKFLGCYDGSE